ncbi:MAG: tRNA adenosine(34) deaminase TadA [Alcaligenaceae bacterium]|uniref:tRNA-specific adenosine deaminase n=1 Tax=Paenalcaligenes hermetiae TaxID=1157987 RepID=A0ABP9M7D5_9BURK|nr:tRNA adenosine(34) deaminase TadA [Paenalcaligenes sp.]NLJ63665.1 tRNA adenosine(34) deaminase TadA [Alcaligenaceae bacterium]
MNVDVREKFSQSDEQTMQLALQLAQRAWQAGEVPVGAVLVDAQGEIIGQGYNQVITQADPTWHAEIEALRQAAQQQQNYRLPGAQLFVTLEPCMMCLGALLHARVARIVYATADPKTGVCGSQLCLHEHTALNHHTQVQAGLYQDQAAQLLRDFFKERRQLAKQRKQTL